MKRLLNRANGIFSKKIKAIQIVISCFLLLFVFTHTYAQAPSSLNANDDIYLTDAEIENIIKEEATAIAQARRFPLSDFESNYTNHFDFLAERIVPILEVKINKVNRQFPKEPQPGTPLFEKKKKLYIVELRNSVREAITNNSALTQRLFIKNINDRIISFHSDVQVQKSGTLHVVETIKIYNGNGGKNDQIKRGIVRDFPTKYTTREGFLSNVPFQLISITKNGEPEQYKTENLINGVRFYLGQSDILLDEGYYTYVITYETGNQLIFHKDKDEIYWNVNGNGWMFKAENVSCKISLPLGANILENNCYTGVQGSKNKDCNFILINDNEVLFKTNYPLNEYEGLTVSTTFKKGFITEPSSLDKKLSFLKDNLIVPLLFFAILLLFLFLYRTWRKVGKDPKSGTIYPQFEPPENISPADCGFLLKQGFSPQLFTASIIDFAVNNKVEIEVKKEGVLIKSTAYYFNKPKNVANPFEHDKMRYLWYGYDIHTLFGLKAAKGHYNSTLAAAYDSLQLNLKKRLLYEGKKSKYSLGLFATNEIYGLFGVLYLFLCIMGTITYFAAFGESKTLIIYAIVMLLIGIIMQILFFRWMKAYSVEGRKILDHILGFKMYLETTEQNIFDKMNPPEMTLQLFEKYLPYAIALGCENKWSDKFESIINQAIQNGYQPSYYTGGTSNIGKFSANSFASSMSSMSSGMSSTISSASSPPSSSSGGSGGGGSSGGGGGGGGGGGW